LRADERYRIVSTFVENRGGRLHFRIRLPGGASRISKLRIVACLLVIIFAQVTVPEVASQSLQLIKSPTDTSFGGVDDNFSPAGLTVTPGAYVEYDMS
jgi:hypothetical protein